MSLCCIC
jgi:hypothetical protein